MTQVQVGDRLRSNDPRDNGKVVHIIEIYGPYIDTRGRCHKWAVYYTGKRKSKIRFDKIFAPVPGVQTRHGYTLLPHQGANL